jgi:hypothetical protein
MHHAVQPSRMTREGGKEKTRMKEIDELLSTDNHKISD